MMVQPGNPRNVPQQMAYPPASKRSRTAAHAQQQMAPGPAPFIAFDDEEDTSQGDMFDHMTPRDISMARYTRNHEWMEEVLGSAYRIGQIVPADLGLGLQGELSSVTQGIFEAPGVDAHKKPPAKPVVGHLDAELATQFRDRIQKRIQDGHSDMAQMKARHEKQMARFQSSLALLRGEKELRGAVDETGPEFWRLEGREEDDEDGVSHSSGKTHRKTDEIVAEIESALGRHIEVVSDVKRVQDGGYQEPAPEPETLHVPPAAPDPGDASGAGPSQPSRQPSHSGSQNSGVIIGDADVDMSGTASGLLDQMQTGMSSNSTPQPQLPTVPSDTATHASVVAPPPQAAAAQAASANTSEDITMQDSGQAAGTNTAPDQGTGSGDWVVVPKGGVSPGASGNGAPAPLSAPGPPEPAQTPGDASRPVDNDFGDVNTAGDALNDLGDGMDLGVEDSAFGDAVYGVEESRDPAVDSLGDGGV